MPPKIGHLVLHNILWRKKQTFFLSLHDKNKVTFHLVTQLTSTLEGAMGKNFVI